VITHKTFECSQRPPTVKLQSCIIDRSVCSAVLRLCRAVSGDSQDELVKVKDTLVMLETGDLDKPSTERSICQVQLQSLGDIRQIALKVSQLYNYYVCSVLDVFNYPII